MLGSQPENTTLCTTPPDVNPQHLPDHTHRVDCNEMIRPRITLGPHGKELDFVSWVNLRENREYPERMSPAPQFYSRS